MCKVMEAVRLSLKDRGCIIERCDGLKRGRKGFNGAYACLSTSPGYQQIVFSPKAAGFGDRPVPVPLITTYPRQECCRSKARHPNSPWPSATCLGSQSFRRSVRYL